MKFSAVLLTTFFAIAAAPAQAQSHHITDVQPDRIHIGDEYIPRQLDLPRVLVVKASQTIELAEDSLFDYIEVAGKLRCSRTHDTTLRVTTLIVLPGGTWDCGTQASPVTRYVSIIIRSVPIDTGKDPFQWGNGLINFGTETRVGAAKLAWTTVTASIAKGATTVTASENVTGWMPGDELLFVDTAQQARMVKPRRETPVTIASITGREIALSKPLDFEHNAILDPTGKIVLLPRVANLTRNILIKSEDPSVVAGHTVNIGPDSHWDIRYNEVRGLGRTKNITLDDTNLSTGHIGTNPRARYAFHDHHAQGFNTRYVGNALVGLGLNGVSGKWCHSVHQTSDGLVQDEICVDFPGAGEVMEDGNETRVAFTHNLVVGSLGNHNGDVNISKANVQDTNNPGGEGSGFWLHGLRATISGNEAWNNAVGMNLFNQDQLPSTYPSQPGGAIDTTFDRVKDVPILFADNVTAANIFDGLEYWGAPYFPAVNHIAAFNAGFQVDQPISVAPKSPYLVNATLICQVGARTLSAISAHSAYVTSLTIVGGYIGGCPVGIENGGQTTTLKNVTLQNVLNINWSTPPYVSSQENVMHVPLPGLPPQFIRFGTDMVWDGRPTDMPRQGFGVPDRGSSNVIFNWQGSGQNFQLFEKQSLSTLAALASVEDNNYQFACPAAGLTMGQCWARYGIAYGGEPSEPGDAVPLAGLVTGLARAGTTPHLGVPRLVVTTPNERASAKLRGAAGAQYVRFVGVFTGDPSQAAMVGRISIDGGPLVKVTPGADGNDVFLAYTSTQAQISPGLHEVRTWRTDHDDKPIGEPLTFHYLISPVRPVSATLPSSSGQR
ncbi:MAG TPA: G8 domain-containing protein [Vicinamibacterales bacterium]|nr:G8 domain-containing protein [Vicinamibacterales bacterium]